MSYCPVKFSDKDRSPKITLSKWPENQSSRYARQKLAQGVRHPKEVDLAWARAVAGGFRATDDTAVGAGAVIVTVQAADAAGNTIVIERDKGPFICRLFGFSRDHAGHGNGNKLDRQ